MRAHHIDVARALCIALVVFGHSELAKLYPEFNSALSSFRMPLFFMLAGTFFTPSRSTWSMAVSKGESLLKPYLSVALLYAPFLILAKGEGSAADYALGVLSFNGLHMPGWLFPMWFLALLWCLHVGCAAFVHATAFEARPRVEKAGWILSLLVVGYALIPVLWHASVCVGSAHWTLQGLPFNLDIWPLAAAMFLTGHVLKKELKTWNLPWPHTLVALSIFALAQWLYAPSLDLLHRDAGHNLLANGVAALSGSLALIGCAQHLSQWPVALRTLLPLGHLSLYVLLFHAPLHSLTAKGMHALAPQAPVIVSWVAALSTLLVCVAMGKSIQSAPWVRALFEPMAKVNRTKAPIAKPSSGMAEVDARLAR